MTWHETDHCAVLVVNATFCKVCVSHTYTYTCICVLSPRCKIYFFRSVNSQKNLKNTTLKLRELDLKSTHFSAHQVTKSLTWTFAAVPHLVFLHESWLPTNMLAHGGQLWKPLLWIPSEIPTVLGIKSRLLTTAIDLTMAWSLPACPTPIQHPSHAALDMFSFSHRRAFVGINPLNMRSNWTSVNVVT